MLDKCYCGPVGKYSGHGLYELFAARGLCGSKSGLGQDFTKDSQPVPLNGFLLPSTRSYPCLPGRQLTILHMFCDIHHISSWINDLCWLCLTLVETWPSIMRPHHRQLCVYHSRLQISVGPSPGSAPALRVCAAGQ